MKWIICFLIFKILTVTSLLVLVHILVELVQEGNHPWENYFGIPLVGGLGSAFIAITIYLHIISAPPYTSKY